MEKLVLNNTPVRTSRNFGINNIEMEIDIPETTEFNNVMIMSDQIDKVQMSEMNIGIPNNKMISKIGMELNKNYDVTFMIPKDTEIEEPIIISFDFDEDNVTLIDNIKIIMEDNSKANFILKYNIDCEECKGTEHNKYFHYLKQETILKDNSEAKIRIENMLGEESNSFIAVENEIGKQAKLEHTLVELGGKNKISNYYSRLVGDESENNLKSIYIGNNNDVIDINYNIEAYGKKTKCNISTEGAISGKAKKNFKGTIDFKKGSSKSKGTENENCMILSNEAKSKSLPMLLCHEEDVEGEHGVSSGKIDESKLFYIMTKGISYKDAQKLIVKANISRLISNENTEIWSKIDKMI